MVVAIIACLPVDYLIVARSEDLASSVFALVGYGALYLTTYAAILFILLYAVSKGMRDFTKRMTHIIVK